MRDVFTKNWGLLIAGAGALITLFALLFLPFVIVTLDLSSSGVERPQGELSVLHVSLSISQLAREYILLWLTMPLALALGMLALLPLVRRRSVVVAGGPLLVREGPQRGLAYLLIGGAVFNILILGLCYLQAAREIQVTYLRYPSVETAVETYFQNLLGGELTTLLGGQALLRHLALMAHASLDIASGIYVAIFGMAAVIAGGLLILTQGGTKRMSGYRAGRSLYESVGLSPTIQRTAPARTGNPGQSAFSEEMSRPSASQGEYLPVEFPPRDV